MIPVQGQPEFDIDPSLEHKKVEAVAPGNGPGRNAVEPARGSGPAATDDDDPGETVFIPRDEEPVAIHAPEPPYPPWAREAGISGSVVLHVLVGRDGHVRRVTVIQDVKGLTEEAKNAVARWVFKPARAGGRAVAVWVAIRVNFRLDGRG